MKKIAIFGAGGFGREVHMLIEQINQARLEYDFIGFFDDNREYHQKLVNGYPVQGGMEELNTWPEPLCIVFAIAEPRTKKKIISRVNNSKLTFPIIKHPSVLLGSNDFTHIGEGSIICAGSIITVNINIGKHVIINLLCTIGHDTTIGDYCSFMPTVNISGEVILEECVYFGTGSQIINQRNVGRNTIIGAGAVVSKDLPDNCTAVGIPAKPIKFFEE